MNWKWKISLMVLFTIGSLCSRAVQFRIEKGATLNDSTPIFRIDARAKDTITYVSIIKSDSAFSLDLKAVALLKVVRRHHGQVGYLGKCFGVFIESKQFDSKDCDFVLVTHWRRHHKMMPPSFGFANFRMELAQQKTWPVHQAQIMVDSGHSLFNVGLAIVFHGFLPFFMKIYSTVTGFEYDFEPMPRAPATRELSEGDGSTGESNDKTCTNNNQDENGETECSAVDPKAAKMQQYARDLLRKNEDSNKSPEEEPAYVWNFVQGGGGTMSPEDEERNFEYAKTYLKMLTLHDGGPMHVLPLKPADAAKDGSYARLAAVYYPSRALFSKILDSQWMYETVQNKRAGDDSLAIVTVPFKPKHPQFSNM